jgi:predicted nucleic acid-binding protein
LPLRLIDSSVWITYLRPAPNAGVVRQVRGVLAAGEAAVAAPILVEVLSGIRDQQEYTMREADFRALHQIQIDAEVGYLAARIGKGLADIGKTARTVDLLLASAAINAGAELWSLPDDHYQEIQALLKRGHIKGSGAFLVHWLT